MKSIYIPSVERYSGKTAICLAIAKHFQDQGKKVGYIKPLGFEPWRVMDKIADEDAAFARDTLGLDAQPWELSPVVITPELLQAKLRGDQTEDLLGKITDACGSFPEETEILVIEGGGSLREGYVVGLPTTKVVEVLGSDVLAVVKYRGRVRLMDDALAAQSRLGDSLQGIIINRVPEDVLEFVTEDAIPYFEKNGIPVLGVLPETRALEALTLQELYNALGEVEILTESYDPEAFIDTVTIGAMTAEAALNRFRKQTNKVVITGGDRSDIQLAALETSTACLVLTGNLHPSSLIIKQAEDLGVPIFLVSATTMDTIETIENIFGKTRLGQSAKLDQFRALFDKHVDMKKFQKVFGILR